MFRTFRTFGTNMLVCLSPEWEPGLRVTGDRVNDFGRVGYV